METCRSHPLGGFGLYATLRAFKGSFYEVGPYLSPFLLAAIDRRFAPLVALFLPRSLIWRFPLGFLRMTCYTTRKAYYRAFLWPAGWRRGEAGELPRRNHFPFILAESTSLFPLAEPSYSWASSGMTPSAHSGLDGHFGIGVGTTEFYWVNYRLN